MPKISVIIPVYNVARYIERCARSLFEQTLDDIEYLFINDCSPDNSITIIKNIMIEYPHRISQTRVLSMRSNQGVATVRKYGMLEATGDYIIHCDGDDWVDIALYESLYNKAVKEHADIVICDEIIEYQNNSQVCEIKDLPNNGHKIISNWYRNTIGLHLHNKLIKRTLYVTNEIYPWEGLNMWEDNGLMFRLLYYGKKISQIHNNVFYHYNKTNINAITIGYGLDHVEQMISIAQNLTLFFNNKPEAQHFANTIKAFQFLAKINLITDSFQNLKRYNETFIGSEYIIPYLDKSAFSLKGRLRFIMVKYNLSFVFIVLYKIYSYFSIIINHKSK